MATTNTKRTNAVGKERRASTSNSHITSTKRTTKPLSITTSSTDKSTSTPSKKQIPNYLKPTISSRFESHSLKHPKSDSAHAHRLQSHSFKQPKSDAAHRPTPNRRRSFDKSPSASGLPKQKEPPPSPSRQLNALVSPGLHQRSTPLRSSAVPVKSTSYWKPISERTSTTSGEGKTQPRLVKSTGKKSSNSTPASSTTKKKVAKDASANSNNAEKSITAETTEALNVVEAEPEVKEAINHEGVREVVKVENEEHVLENVSEIPPQVDSEHDERVHGHELKESDQPHIEADDNIEADDRKIIPSVSEEEAKDGPQEEKTEDDEHIEEEDQKNTNPDESSHPEKHFESEGEVEVKRENEEGGEEKEGGLIIEDHKIENKNEEEEVVEKEGVKEGGISDKVVKLREGQDYDDDDDNVETSEVIEAKDDESTKPKQQAGVVQGKKQESQVSNGVIEETTSKLMEARKNKVRAMAGAFQTVIDYQTTPK